MTTRPDASHDAPGLPIEQPMHRAGWQIDGWGYAVAHAVLARDYRPWNREHIIVDTSGTTADTSVAQLRAALTHPEGTG